MRSTWAALGPGCGGWAVGQAWWAHQEIAGAGIPFPSVADLGFVAFPVLAATALLLHPTDGGARGLWRRTSDAVMTTAAVGLVSWESALGAIADRAAEEGRLAGALFLAYPVLDVVLIVLAVLTAARTRQPRLPLLVCAGLVALSVSDTVSAYLQAAGSYRGGSVDVGWVAGFLLLALAGTARPPAAGDRTAGPPSTAGGERTVAPLHADLLPCVPAAVALVSALVHALAGGALGIIDVALATLVLALILVRQFVALRENARLGGDEFAILLESGADVRQATAQALEALAPPVVVDGRPVVIRASVGVPGLGADDPPARADLLLGCSDAAMYAAKRAGGDRVVGYATGPQLPVGAAHAVGPAARRGRA